MSLVKFSFEDLTVWRRAVEFVDHVLVAIEALESDRKHYRLIEQLEAAVTSIPMNIAEGNRIMERSEKADERDLQFDDGIEVL